MTDEIGDVSARLKCGRENPVAATRLRDVFPTYPGLRYPPQQVQKKDLLGTPATLRPGLDYRRAYGARFLELLVPLPKTKASSHAHTEAVPLQNTQASKSSETRDVSLGVRDRR